MSIILPFLETMRVLQANVPDFKSENLIGNVKKSPLSASWIETLDASDSGCWSKAKFLTTYNINNVV